MSMFERLGFKANLASPLGNALYVIRLRQMAPFRSGGQWIRRPFKLRVETIRSETDGARRSRKIPPWLPAGGRQSPREEMMGWRRSMVRYAYPGWMRFYQGKAPALVGRTQLYNPFASRTPLGSAGRSPS